MSEDAVRVEIVRNSSGVFGHKNLEMGGNCEVQRQK